MTNEHVILLPDFKAAADLSAKQFYIVKLTAENTVNIADAATAAIVGVLTNDPASGKAAAVAGPGSVAPVITGGSISVGALVTSDANGKAVAASTEGSRILGIALSASTGADQYIKVLVVPGGVLAVLGTA